VLDRQSAVVAASLGAPATPLVSQIVAPGESVFLGSVQTAADNGDYWMTARGAVAPGRR
jgi:hypothetical protein